MNLNFWQQVSEGWLSVRQDAELTAVDLTQFRTILNQDISSIKNQAIKAETKLEIDHDDDFWGGL